jgi:desulfoferrodoxin (superoxide reductase-like protein)
MMQKGSFTVQVKQAVFSFPSAQNDSTQSDHHISSLRKPRTDCFMSRQAFRANLKQAVCLDFKADHSFTLKTHIFCNRTKRHWQGKIQ